MKKLLYILGGMRIGDTFHCIPILDKFRKEGYDVTWITGTYERQAVEFLKGQFRNISNVHFYDDSKPTDLASRERFLEKYGKQEDWNKYDEVVTDIRASFDNCYNDFPTLETKYLDFETAAGDYIVYHLDTCSDFKTCNFIRNLKLNHKGYSIGLPREFMLPGTMDFRGKPLNEVAELISKARLFVGIHSSMTCLTFYINKPAVVIHPFEGLLMFRDWRSNMLDLVQPSTETLLEVIKSKL